MNIFLFIFFILFFFFWGGGGGGGVKIFSDPKWHNNVIAGAERFWKILLFREIILCILESFLKVNVQNGTILWGC